MLYLHILKDGVDYYMPFPEEFELHYNKLVLDDGFVVELDPATYRVFFLAKYGGFNPPPLCVPVGENNER